jgi:ribonuclease R
MYQRLSLKLAGKPEERILSHLMLRSLKQARYSEKNEGHFALATPAYTHFTSPIRRYPDLIVHRICKALLHEGIPGEANPPQKRVPHPSAARMGERDAHTPASIEPPISETELAAIAQETSETERRAADAERELIEWKKVKFMQDRIGEDFDAIVLNPTKYGLFIELDEIFIEGLVPIESLSAADPNHETFTYRENTRQIISAGRHGPSKRYSAGDRIHVVLERIDAVERRLQFGIYVDLETLNAGMRKSKKSGAKKADKKSKQTAKTSAQHKTKARDKNKGKHKKK